MCGILAYPVPISSYSPPRQHWKPRAIITVKSGNLVDTGGAVTQLLSHFWLLGPHRLEPTRLLCSWGFSGKNIGVGCHFLLQGIFPTQGSNSCLLHWQLDSLPLSHRRKFSSVQSLSRVWLWLHGLQQTKLPCPSPATRAYSNSCPPSWWCHPTTSSSVILFSSCLQSFPASESFQMSHFFASGIGVSASVLQMNIQDSFLLGCTG